MSQPQMGKKFSLVTESITFPQISSQLIKLFPQITNRRNKTLPNAEAKRRQMRK